METLEINAFDSFDLKDCKVKEKKYNSFYEYTMDAVETVWKSQKGRPENYIILSSEQIERLENGESEFEIGVGAVPIITRDEYLKKN